VVLMQFSNNVHLYSCKDTIGRWPDNLNAEILNLFTPNFGFHKIDNLKFQGRFAL
jgi:hypothetical protein